MDIFELIKSKRFTVLLGKNGAGKSTLLRTIDNRADLNTRYVSPERGGVLKYEPGIDQNIANDINWLTNSRRQNRIEFFRQQSAAQFRNLEILFLREIESIAEKRADSTYTFDTVLNELNQFLPAIRLKRSDRGFSITAIDGSAIDEAQISSGESEFIALAIELLVYSRADAADKFLLLDEPDVHLHPDLQSKFVEFIEKTALASDMHVVIATHSTAIISAFNDGADLQVVPVSNRLQNDFDSFTRNKVSDELLPVFGAHPLSSVFNRSPIVLVEGDDDRRVIEQLVRSAQGRIKLTPCAVGSVDEMGQWEQWLEKFLPVIYDNPKAISLRDLDDASVAEINDLPHVIRCKLNCYAIENLLVTDEALANSNSSPDQLRESLIAWIEAFPGHAHLEDAHHLVDNFASRRTIKVKNLRNVVIAILGSNKPWEVYLGQLLAQPGWNASKSPDSLANYLGVKASGILS